MARIRRPHTTDKRRQDTHRALKSGAAVAAPSGVPNRSAPSALGTRPGGDRAAPSDGHPRSQLAAAVHGLPCAAAAAVPTPGARRGLCVPPRHTSHAARAVLPAGTGGGRHRGVARLMIDPPLQLCKCNRSNALGGGGPFTLG